MGAITKFSDDDIVYYDTKIFLFQRENFFFNYYFENVTLVRKKFKGMPNSLEKKKKLQHKIKTKT